MSSSGGPYSSEGRDPRQDWPVPNRIILDPCGAPGPAALYIGDDDAFYVRIHNSAAGVVVTVRVRLQGPAGQVAPQEFSFAPPTDRSEFIRVQQLAEGYILGVTAFASSGTPRRGQCFVECGTMRGGAVAASVVQPIFADYITTGAATGWPGGRICASVEDPGVLRSVTGTDPAAGAEVSESVPTNARWRLRSLRVPLVTSAVVANRRPHLVVDDGATILFDFAAGDTQAASLTRNYNSGPDGFARVAQDNEIYIPSHYQLMLFQGWRVRTVTTALDAGDNYGPPQLNVEEWIED